MSERGVFAVDRGLFEHPMFAREPFTEREAWQWLISAAAWKPMRVRVGAAVVDLKRGQLSHSLRFMAAKWQWSEPRVRRFLNRLCSGQSSRGGRPARNLEKPPSKTDALIDAATDAGVTVITIRNYDKYQRVSLPDDAATDAPIDAEATQQRRKEEYIQGIESPSLRSGRDEVERPPGDLFGKRDPKSPDAKARLWSDGKAELEAMGVPHDKARRMLGKWLRDCGNDYESVLVAIVDARKTGPPVDPIPFITASLNRKFSNGISTYNPRTDRNAGSGQTHGDAVLAGMGRIAGRLVERERAARRQDPDLSRTGGLAGGSDADDR